jgi:hypothetical protein
MIQPFQVLATFAFATMLSLVTLGVVGATAIKFVKLLLVGGTVAYHLLIQT